MQLNFLPNNVASNVWKLHYGQSALLLTITYELLCYIIELHDQGMVVNSCIVSHNASYLCNDFQEKSERIKANVIFRWLKSHASKYPMHTHQTQTSAADALDFMQYIHQKVSEQNHDPKFVINMDQTKVLVTSPSKKTLEKWKGTKTIHICTMNEPK